MRYTEKSYDREVKNPIDMIIFIVYMFLTAPTRLLSEISKKVIFLGEYARKFLLGVILMNTGLLVLTVLYSLFILKRISLTYGMFSPVSIIISLAISVGLFILFDKFSYEIDFDAVESDIEEIKDFNIPEKPIQYTDIEGTIINNPEEYEGDKLEILDETDEILRTLIDEDTTISESIDDSRVNINHIDLSELLNSTPKTNIDPLYKHDNKEGDDVMFELLKNGIIGRSRADVAIADEEAIMSEENKEKTKQEIGLDFDDAEDFFESEEESADMMMQIHNNRMNKLNTNRTSILESIIDDDDFDNY